VAKSALAALWMNSTKDEQILHIKKNMGGNTAKSVES
jgi:hypothetical protein